ncbi:flagellar assembly protein FliW [Paenibacillus agaridevorans]|uniref:Flagellar assembly factor FliW n=1 Tax=Paenibacillus agaridevorans TaxID=171404 RepID=A0A2R5EUZ5_9BACL|nr:flagellar assembly protein FliW [Paenibacillus agaridevorans]GBG07194.1 flagellar assembly protein FliW [Paenibacillus agaridevorans]
MMLLQTSRFGALEIQRNDVYDFQQGIPGFKDLHKYMLIEIDDSPFKYLQSVDNGELSFIVVSPFEFFENYEFILPQEVQTILDIEDEKQVRILNIISIREELASATINLAAPIVMNTERMKGMQYILPDGSYSIHQPLFNAIEVVKGGQ